MSDHYSGVLESYLRVVGSVLRAKWSKSYSRCYILWNIAGAVACVKAVTPGTQCGEELANTAFFLFLLGFLATHRVKVA